MQRIPPAPPINLPKEDKLIGRVARRNPKTYGGRYNPMELDEWIKTIEKIFVITKVPEEKRVNIGTFYLTEEADIWWNTVRDRFTRPELTWSKFLEKLRVNSSPSRFNAKKRRSFLN